MSGFKPVAAVYGGANIDIQARCRGPYRAGDSNPGEASITHGGVGRNIAENLAGLGVPTELVTVFGGDDQSSGLAEGCRRAGIEIGSSLFLRSEPCSRYICLLDDDGTLVGAVAAMDSLEAFGPGELASRFGPGDAAEVVVLDANLPADTVALAAERWKGKPLVLDSVSVAKARRVAPAVGLFGLVKPNRAEARALLSLDPSASPADPEADALESARGLLARGVREAFVSLGAGGFLWASAAGAGFARPLAMPVVNVSGAGDAAAAALAWAAARGLDTETKARYAVAAASVCAADERAVAAGVNAERLSELIQGVVCERIA